ncbi:MAG: hypothetical protein UR98_C0002G0002 [Parcubacteria group bacterium GW2011_GWA1_36_12]|nr:MAG: hypothetical protein UR98_C0002G0002 [Parcubacteria group bacterium GW2011_GWA1_36_12]
MATTFSESIIKELGLDNMSEDKKVEVLLGIGRIIQQNIILRILDELKEKDKKEFDKFLAKNGSDQEAILKFLQSKIHNLDTIIDEEIDNFKKTSVDFLTKITQ